MSDGADLAGEEPGDPLHARETDLSVRGREKGKSMGDPNYTPTVPRIFMTKVGNQKLRTAIWEGRDKGFPGPGGKRTPLLFFNGIGANLEIAQMFADSFTGRDIVTFDMPGIGGSPDPKIPYRPGWVAKAARQILDAEGYKYVDVLGVSWGGGAAQHFAWANRTITKRLILCATAPGVTMVPGRPRQLLKMASPKRYISRDFMKKNFEAIYGDSASEGLDDFRRNLIPPSTKGYLYQLLAMSGYSSLPYLRCIRARTLILMGENDHIVPVVNGRIMARLIPHARMEVIADAGHLFMVTKREETVSRIRAFFHEPPVPLPAVEGVELPSHAASFAHGLG